MTLSGDEQKIHKHCKTAGTNPPVASAENIHKIKRYPKPDGLIRCCMDINEVARCKLFFFPVSRPCYATDAAAGHHAGAFFTSAGSDAPVRPVTLDHL